MAYATIPASTGGSGAAPLDWFNGRQARAISLLNASATQVSHPTSYNFGVNAGYTAATANPPTFSTAYSGGVYSFPGGGTSSILLPGGGAATPTLVAAMKTEAWYVAALVRIAASAAGAGKVCAPLRIINAGNAHFIELGWSATDSTTIAEIIMTDGTAATGACGTVGTIGASTCPVNAWFTMELYFDANAGTLNAGFQDTLAVSMSGSQLNHMPTDSGIFEFFSNDNTLVALCGGMFSMVAGLS